MTTPKLQEIARGLCMADGKSADQTVMIEGAPLPQWREYLEQARIVCGFLRNCSTSMITAGHNAGCENPEEIFQAMIDTAMGEE